MVSFVNPYRFGAGPGGSDLSYLYAQISNQAGNVAANGAFEPTMGTVDYSGPTGATTENSNKITIQAGDDGDYISLAQLNYVAPGAAGSQSITARCKDSGATLIDEGGKSERVLSSGVGYGRSLISFNASPLVDGDYAEGAAFMTNVGGTEVYNNGTSLSVLQPGACLAAIRLSADQTSVTNGTSIAYNELVTGYASAADLSGGSITVNTSGWYLVLGATSSTSSGTICGMQITGSTTGNIISCAEYSAVGGGNKGQCCFGLAQLSGGEDISATALLNSTVDLVADKSLLSIWRVKSSDVLAVLGRASDYNVPNASTGNQAIAMDSVIHGSGSLVTANSGSLTIQETGWYLVMFSTDMARGSAAECFASPRVFNTTTGELGPYYGFEIEQAAGTYHARSGMKAMYCTAGDILDLNIYTVTGQPTITLKSSENTRFSLIKLTAST